MLVVERFDRVWMKDGRLLRLPQEDFCQALSVPPSRKYESGGGFNLVPLYDVISIEPNIKAGLIFEDKAKLAMAVGDNRHYRLGEIQKLHFIETAAKAGIQATCVEQVFEDLCKRAPAALRKIKAELPEDFPTDISEPILAGFKKRLKILKDRHKEA